MGIEKVLEEAREAVRKTIPSHIEVTDVDFEGPVIVIYTRNLEEFDSEAVSPGLVIGKHGAVLNEIKKEIGWAPKVVRAPPIPSKTVSDIRTYLRKNQEDRKEVLRKVGRRLMAPRL